MFGPSGPQVATKSGQPSSQALRIRVLRVAERGMGESFGLSIVMAGRKARSAVLAFSNPAIHVFSTTYADEGDAALAADALRAAGAAGGGAKRAVDVGEEVGVSSQ